MSKDEIKFDDDLIIGFGKYKNEQLGDVPWALEYLLQIDPKKMSIQNGYIKINKNTSILSIPFELMTESEIGHMSRRLSRINKYILNKHGDIQPQDGEYGVLLEYYDLNFNLVEEEEFLEQDYRENNNLDEFGNFIY